MNDIFRIVKEQVNMHDLVRFLGFEEKGKKILCPFHGDKTPSMQVNDKYAYCHSCHKSYDAVEFVAQIKGIRPIEAVRWININMSLGLDLSPSIEYKAWKMCAIKTVEELCRLLGRVENAEHILECYEYIHDDLIRMDDRSAYMYEEEVKRCAGLIKRYKEHMKNVEPKAALEIVDIHDDIKHDILTGDYIAKHPESWIEFPGGFREEDMPDWMKDEYQKVSCDRNKLMVSGDILRYDEDFWLKKSDTI